MTLREAIEQAHCRQGKAAGTTKDGAYWLCYKSGKKPVTIRSWGGDGIGQSAPDRTNRLELRHYRDGAVRARIGSRSGDGDWYANADAILDCTTAEDVIVILKGIRYDDEPVYSDHFESNLTTELWALGLPASEPAPDEQEVKA